MHSSSFDSDRDSARSGADVLVAITTLVTEGRIPRKISKSRGFYEGPHCPSQKNTPTVHNCDPTEILCQEYEQVQSQVSNLWKKNIPVCVEVYLAPECSCEDNEFLQDSPSYSTGRLLLEQWYLNVNHHRNSDTTTPFNFNQLISAVRSQLCFSQISAWLSAPPEDLSVGDRALSAKNFKYRLTLPGETFQHCGFTVASPSRHDFPPTDLGNGTTLSVTLLSLPRTGELPKLKCPKCEDKTLTGVDTKCKFESLVEVELPPPFDDRMRTTCTMKGKHRCEDYYEEPEAGTFPDAGRDRKMSRPNKFVQMKVVEEIRPEAPSSVSATREKPKLFLDILSAQQMNIQCHDDKTRHSFLTSKTKSDVTNTSTTKSNTLFKSFDSKYSSRESKKNATFCNNESGENSCIDKKIGNVQSSEFDLNHRKIKHIPTQNQILVPDLSVVRCISLTPSDSTNGPGTEREQTVPGSCSDNRCDRDDACDSSYQDKAVRNFQRMRDVSNIFQNVSSGRGKARQRITFENYVGNGYVMGEMCKSLVKAGEDDQFSCDSKKLDKCKGLQCNLRVSVCKDGQSTEKPILNFADVPSHVEQIKFRKSLDNAASMVFHSRTGLPLTSSPAPVRRGKRFDFDSTITSVSAIKSAIFSTSLSIDDDSESDGSAISPCSPDAFTPQKEDPPPSKYYKKGRPSNLLGTFEESVLKGRLEPVSTVQGFTAELGASGSFVPKHLVLPVTVFFYTLGDNDKVSSPYLGHINIGKRGYSIPKTGTVQVTLFNPLGTVVKMFVIMYDLSDMPPNSQTFIRQRTLLMPANCQDKNLEWGPKWLRYLIHLRFGSTKSGRVYLHRDIRMIIFRKSDLDTATAHGIDMSYELRSFTHMPANPKYSPKKCSPML